MFLNKNILTKFKLLIDILFSGKTNLLFVDYNYNYNYLPISNKILFSRSSKNLVKTIKFFNVSAIIFLNLNKKKFILKKFIKFNLINISSNFLIKSPAIDFCLNLPNSNFYNYLLFIFILESKLKN